MKKFVKGALIGAAILSIPCWYGITRHNGKSQLDNWEREAAEVQRLIAKEGDRSTAKMIYEQNIDGIIGTLANEANWPKFYEKELINAKNNFDKAYSGNLTNKYTISSTQR